VLNLFRPSSLLKLIIVMAFVGLANSEQAKNTVETLDEVSIIGNSELPRVNFSLLWQLPSVENRDEQSPPKKIEGVLTPLEPRRYKQQIHFSRFLEVDAPHFQAR